MSNPLFPGNNSFNNSQNYNNPISNLSNLMDSFNNFKMGFTGDPRQKVQELLASGQMTQEQFNQFSALARKFVR